MKRFQSKFAILALAGALLLPSALRAEVPQGDFEKAMDKYLSNEKNVEKIGNSLQALIRKQREEQEKQRAQSETQEMEEQFKNPVKVELGESPVRGKADAKVTIVEFSDFQCPFCQRGAMVMDQVLKEYPNDVKLVFKNLPLSFHQEARPAAKAALAAKEQGKFWEMYDELFANQHKLGADAYLEFAQKIGLNIDKFKADLASDKVEKMIQSDSDQAASLGVQGTPAFFVGGVKVSGARPLQSFKEIIDRLLKDQKK